MEHVSLLTLDSLVPTGEALRDRPWFIASLPDSLCPLGQVPPALSGPGCQGDRHGETQPAAGWGLAVRSGRDPFDRGPAMVWMPLPTQMSRQTTRGGAGGAALLLSCGQEGGDVPGWPRAGQGLGPLLWLLSTHTVGIFQGSPLEGENRTCWGSPRPLTKGHTGS